MNKNTDRSAFFYDSAAWRLGRQHEMDTNGSNHGILHVVGVRLMQVSPRFKECTTITMYAYQNKEGIADPGSQISNPIFDLETRHIKQLTFFEVK